MPVDIETELVQMWAGSRVVAGVMKDKLLASEASLTISTIGLRPGHDHQIAGLAQILHLTQSYTLEVAIKALHKRLNPKSNPEETHDLLRLFDALNKNVKTRLRLEWQKTTGLSTVAKELTLDEFLGKYRLIFEESRYLFEKNRSYTLHTKDFDIAIWVITNELIRRQPDDTVLYNLFNVLSEEKGGLLGSSQARPPGTSAS